MPSRSVPFGVKPRTWSATSSPRKPSMGSPASNPYAPTPRACWIPAANTGVLKTVSTTFATSPLMKIARASAVAQAPRSWPPFAISPYRFSASPELATSPQHVAAVLVRAIPSSFASSGCDFDVAVGGELENPAWRPENTVSFKQVSGPGVAGTIKNYKTQKWGPGNIIIVPAGVPHTIGFEVTVTGLRA